MHKLQGRGRSGQCRLGHRSGFKVQFLYLLRHLKQVVFLLFLLLNERFFKCFIIFKSFPHDVIKSHNNPFSPTTPVFPSGKESACNAGDLDSIPGLGRFPGGVNSNPLQNSHLQNPRYRGAWRATVLGVAKSRTRLSDLGRTPHVPLLPPLSPLATTGLFSVICESTKQVTLDSLRKQSDFLSVKWR